MEHASGIVAAGGARIDYLITRQGKAHLHLPGGNAVYSAVGAALWSPGVGIWCRVGQNFPASWLADLTDRGISSHGLVRIAGNQEHRTFYAYSGSGRRDDRNPARHFARIGKPLPDELEGYISSTPGQDDPETYEPLALRPEDWPPGYSGAKAVHLAPISVRTHAKVPASLRGRGVELVTVDPGERYMRPGLTDTIRDFLPHADAFLPSLMEVRSLFGASTDPWSAAQMLGDWGARIVIVKAGAAGVYVRESRSGRQVRLEAYHQPGDPRVVDVTGAGDGFCGGFLAGLLETGDAIQAALRGLVSASLVVEGYGALYALASRRADARPRLDELRERLACC